MKKLNRKRKRVDWADFGLAVAAQVLSSIIVALLLIIIAALLGLAITSLL